MIRRFLLLNGLAVLCVVLNHSAAWGYIALFWWPHQYRPVQSPNFDQFGGATYYSLRAIEQLIIFGIPAFLFVSGFFVAFASGKKANLSWKVIGARIRSLALPYLLWSVVMLLARVAQGDSYRPDEVIRILLTGRATQAFYFVPLLIQLFALAPILVRLARANWKALLLIAGLTQLGVKLLIYVDTLGVPVPGLQPLMWLTTSWFFPGNLFWFAAGIVVGFNLQSLKLAIGRLRWPLLALTALFFAAGMVEWEVILRASGEQWLTPKETLLDNLYSAAFILTFLAFDYVAAPLARNLEDLGAKSYGVYLVHSLALEFTARGIYVVAPILLASQFLFQPILIAVGLGVPLLMMAMVNLNRSPVRGYYQYIFG